MEFRGLETSVVEVLRAPELQRLRRIRQLGLAHLVFPAAEHSRMVHCLGASHLAIRFANRLRDATRDTLTALLCADEEATRDLALAALCHDLGHGPLSHVWEAAVVGDFDQDAWKDSLGLAGREGLDDLKWHELVGQALLLWPDGELHQLLEQQEEGTSERIAEMLLGRHYLPYLPQLLSGDVDVDRCDYIMRDARMTGVAYGRYDLNWLISTATIGETDTGQLVVGFDHRKSVRVLEQLLIARRALYETVYYHRTVRAAEGMIGRFLRRLKVVASEGDQLVTEGEIFAPFQSVISGSALKPDEILGLDDYALWVLIQHVAGLDQVDVTLKDLANRIISRDLFKQVDVSEEALSNFMFGDDPYPRIYDAVRPFCAGDPQSYVHFDKVTFDVLGSTKSGPVYFVDGDLQGVGKVCLGRDEELRALLGAPLRTTRLFAPREAIDALQKLIEP